MAGRVLVAVKRAADYNARIRVKPDKVRAWNQASATATRSLSEAQRDEHHLRPVLACLQTGVDLSNVKMSMNPFCEVRRCRCCGSTARC